MIADEGKSVNNTKSNSGILAPGLITNKFAILVELVVIFTPLYLGLILGERLSNNTIPLGDNLIVLGGPQIYLGLVFTLLLLKIFSKRRGANWSTYGIRKPRNWLVTILKSLAVALLVLASVVMVINPLLQSIPNLEPRDMSHFNVLTGNLPNLIINLVLMWITAGFLEEFLWRGYLMERLLDLIGSNSWSAVLTVILVSSTIFGLAHGYQGLLGVLKTGAVGLVFGFSYFIFKRNLWPLVLAHALIDTLDFITHFLRG
jgi:uncharacterized protein